MKREHGVHVDASNAINMRGGNTEPACAHAQIPGRMSDSAVAGAGAYAETGVGGCGSTGDGDIHLRFLPCYQVRFPLSLR